ncbi:LOW QUALITY PROTEIN: synaptic vesicle membrane protein VAT-1 homolog [Macrobrachium nipponense]|uniref:LOW QUALITY PROTEIN: synaptic vesicle membrane protein VAT-1 homolog n=1 Tax=Macrobrachium nipponense TaxID=159736 RepID=UPI0030C825DC
MVRRIVVKAVGGFDQLQVEEGPPAHSPKSKQVTVEIKACGLNFYDLYVQQGLSPEVQPPCTLGLECSGLVKAVGDEVTSVKVGNKVAVHCPKGGAFAEEITVDEDSVLLVPHHLSYDEAAAFTVNYLTAYFTLFYAGGLREGGAVLIHSAAGGVGWAATQLAKTVPNVTVFGRASSHKHGLITQNGVDYPISHDQNYSDIVLQHRKQGVSIVLDDLSGADFTVSQQLLEPLGKEQAIFSI